MSFTPIILVAFLPAADWPLSIDGFFFPRVERILMRNRRECVHEYARKYRERERVRARGTFLWDSNVKAKIFVARFAPD